MNPWSVEHWVRTAEMIPCVIIQTEKLNHCVSVTLKKKKQKLIDKHIAVESRWCKVINCCAYQRQTPYKEPWDNTWVEISVVQYYLSCLGKENIQQLQLQLVPSVALMSYIIIPFTAAGNMGEMRERERPTNAYLQTCNPRKAMRTELMLPRTPSGSYGMWVAYITFIEMETNFSTQASVF